jgi:hypothetical protein
VASYRVLSADQTLPYIGSALAGARSAWLFDRLGYGVRLETATYFTKVRYPEASEHGDVLTKRGDVAMSLVFGG